MSMTDPDIIDSEHDQPAPEGSPADHLPSDLDRHPFHGEPHGPTTFPDAGDPFNYNADARESGEHPEPIHEADARNLMYLAKHIVTSWSRVEQRRTNDSTTSKVVVTKRQKIAQFDRGRSELLVVNNGTTDVNLGAGNDAPCLIFVEGTATDSQPYSFNHGGMAELWAEPAVSGETVELVLVTERFIGGNDHA